MVHPLIREAVVEFVVETEVEAPASAVWAVLVDPAHWPAWTPSITSVELFGGPLGPESRARVAQPRMPLMVWTVTRWEPGSAFTWTSNTAGVVTEGSHEVRPLDEHRSRLTLGIRQRGVAAPPVSVVLGRRTRRYVRAEAAGLAAAAESRSMTPSVPRRKFGTYLDGPASR